MAIHLEFNTGKTAPEQSVKTNLLAEGYPGLPQAIPVGDVVQFPSGRPYTGSSYDPEWFITRGVPIMSPGEFLMRDMWERFQAWRRD